ncbi:MAG: metallophosphoesterase [Planctomycetota bacterium]|nr:MAG: metallophosphoesterase [Planctomycetota bacterium]
MIAVLSDIHSNLPAIEAVLADVKARGITRIFFLGDLIGYGPDPFEVLAFLSLFELKVIGNHDETLLNGVPAGFNPVARRAAEWTVRQVHPDHHRNRLAFKALRLKRRALETFSRMPRQAVAEGMIFFHDTPLAPGSSDYVRDENDARRSFEMYPDFSVFFVGHSHLPRIFTADAVLVPRPGRFYPFDRKMIINVGSVGQPRDKDPRACYVILEEGGFRYIRVPYDVDAAARRILENPELDNFLAQRLLLGK